MYLVSRLKVTTTIKKILNERVKKIEKPSKIEKNQPAFDGAILAPNGTASRKTNNHNNNNATFLVLPTHKYQCMYLHFLKRLDALREACLPQVDDDLSPSIASSNHFCVYQNRLFVQKSVHVPNEEVENTIKN